MTVAELAEASMSAISEIFKREPHGPRTSLKQLRKTLSDRLQTITRTQAAPELKIAPAENPADCSEVTLTLTLSPQVLVMLRELQASDPYGERDIEVTISKIIEGSVELRREWLTLLDNREKSALFRAFAPQNDNRYFAVPA